MTFFGRADVRLLQSFRDGERAALESVYRAYADSVARAIAGVLRRYGREGWHGGWREIAAEVPDLVQEVFARAFEPKTRRSFDGVRDYGPYLRQIARNVVVDHFRRKRRQAFRDSESFIVDEISMEARPNEQAADMETMAIVSDYVASLSHELKRVHEAMYVEGLSQREAAAALGLGRQVVRTLEARLREGLRSALEAGLRSAARSEVRRGPDLGAAFGGPKGSVTR